MAKNNHDPNEEQDQDIEFERTMNLEDNSDSDLDLENVPEDNSTEQDQDDDYASGTGGQTIALGDDVDLIDELLQADESQSESDHTGTVDNDPDAYGNGDRVLTEKLGPSGSSAQIGSNTIGSNTIDSGSMGSSQLASIWRKHFGSDANPMMSFETGGPAKSSIGAEFKLNPRYVKSGMRKVVTEEEIEKEIDYRLGRMVGEGGMGEVYSAIQQAVDRKVAFKQIRKELIDETNNNPKKRKRIERKFLTEGHITASLDHPNIVTIHDLGIAQNGSVFYCMEFITGSEWNQVFDKLSLDENLDILLHVADGIAYAHSRDIIHRDLKPENVMIGKFNQVSIMDWGLAVDLSQGTPSNLAGTPAYLAPEMAKGPKGAVNKSSDIYLLGAVLFHICTGRPPHYGKSMSACIQSAARNTFRKYMLSHESLKPLLDIAFKAMATQQEDRYATVVDFQDAIGAYRSAQQNIAQSFALSEKSQRELEEAKQVGDYEKFSSALFGFREAGRLFPENSDATSGLSLTKHAYADCALQREDFELGLSLLDEDEEDDGPLIQQLKKSRKTVESRKSRVKFFAIASALLFSGFFVYFAYSNNKQTQLAAERQTALESAKKENIRAVNAEIEAKKARKETLKQFKEATKAKKKAEVSLIAERNAKEAFELERNKARESLKNETAAKKEVAKSLDDVKKARDEADMAPKLPRRRRKKRTRT